LNRADRASVGDARVVSGGAGAQLGKCGFASPQFSRSGDRGWLVDAGISGMREEDEIDDVLKVVSSFFGVPRRAIQSLTRTQRVHRARCIGMYLAHCRGMDDREIGLRFGNRDYTIVRDVCRKFAHGLSFDAGEAKLIEDPQQACAAATRKRTGGRSV
jgi:hypothetical protein